jgi:hypothetical protein
VASKLPELQIPLKKSLFSFLRENRAFSACQQKISVATLFDLDITLRHKMEEETGI